MRRTPFVFGIPLISRAAARSWARIEALLSLTLSSLLAQTDCDFRVIVAGHDRPDCASGDPRITFLRADWPAGPPDGRNLDGGRKKEAIKQAVLADGGGLLMFVDADDWLDVRLVATARTEMDGDCAGAVVRAGCALDIGTLRHAALPHPELFDGGFHRLCGSSTLVRLDPRASDPLRRDPNLVLHEHYRFVEMAAQHRLPIRDLDVAGCYLVNTAENHSELHGPFADWRRTFTEKLNELGRPLAARTAARFGLDLERVRAASRLLAG